MNEEILTKLKEINDLLNMIHGNQPKADMAFYELQKLKQLLQEESAWEMFGRLYKHSDFLNQLEIYYCVVSIKEAMRLLARGSGSGAKNVMQEIEKKLKE